MSVKLDVWANERGEDAAGCQDCPWEPAEWIDSVRLAAAGHARKTGHTTWAVIDRAFTYTPKKES